MRFVVGAVTDVGRGRPANEDTFLVDELHDLYAVADGMGGHRAGEVASATAIESLRAAFAGGTPLPEAIETANTAVYAKADENPDMRGMGTTITAVTLPRATPDGVVSALLGHVGDSRAYLFRDRGTTRLTEDHSLVERLVREGQITPEQALEHPQRAIITRALGIEADVDVDVYQVDLRPGDRILLCSDGLTNMVSEADMDGVLRRVRDPQEAAQTLVDMANEAGGGDNITVVLLDAHGDATDSPTGNRAVDGEEDAPAEEEEQPAPALASAPGGATAATPRRARRALIWALPVVLILGTGFAAVGWYARRTYYVGVQGMEVTLYRGVPGGVLGWDPTVEDRTGVMTVVLSGAERVDLESGHRFSSRGEAEAFIERLRARRIGPPRVQAPDEPVGGDDPVLLPGDAREPAASITTTTTTSRGAAR